MWIADYSSLITAGVTVVLVILTAFYVVHTGAMAKAMKEELSMIKRGHLGINSFSAKPDRARAYFGTLRNYGSAPLVITKRTFWEGENITAEQDSKFTMFPNQEQDMQLADRRDTPTIIKVRFEYVTLGREQYTEYELDLSYSERAGGHFKTLAVRTG